MVELYSGKEYPKEFALKKRMLTYWLILLGIYLALCVISVVSFAALPYGTKKTPFIMFNIGLSAIFWGYSLFFFVNRYNRVRKYVKMLSYIETGMRETYDGQFLRFDDTLEVKEGVDFYKMITKEWNDRKQDFFERKVLIDCEKPKPEIPMGARVRYITQGNILVMYKILRAPAEEEN